MKSLVIPIFSLALLTLLSIFSINSQLVSEIPSEDASLSQFSANRAFKHLEIIAQKPHSSGTEEHEKVFNYILNYCKSKNLEVTVQDTMAAVVYGQSRVNASQIKNILARLKGTNPNKKNILVLSHYDSQPNTPGAADDGAGISAMLESIRALLAGPRLEHDVLFLFTDQEEMGLLGAEAFVNSNPEVERTGALLNYESRGNAGAAYVFEVSSENGWVIRQFEQGAPYPIANSMAYEIYRRMPNSTDFTRFKRGNYTGINQANVDGFANYHNMTDTPENIDLRLVQHHGSNMLGMIRQFDQQDLTNTKAPDANYFNPIGHHLWIYPTQWNLPLICLCLGLFIILILSNSKIHKQSPFQSLLGTIPFILSIVSSLFFSWLLLSIILKSYPHYANHYGNNFYNSGAYLYAFLGITWLAFGFFYSFLFKKLSSNHFFEGALFVCILIMIGMHIWLPTSSYLIYYPLIILLTLNLLASFLTEKKYIQQLIHGIGLIPGVCLFAPIIYTLYVVFSLQLPYGAVFIFALLLGLIAPFFIAFRQNRMLLLSPGILLLLGGMIYGHLNAYPTVKEGLQTSLSYVYNVDTDQAHWFSDDPYRDDWIKKYAPDESTFSDLKILPVRGLNAISKKIWTGKTEKKPLKVASVIRKIDTLANHQIRNTIHIKPQRDIIGCQLLIDGIDGTNVTLNGRPIDWNISNDNAANHLVFQTIRPEGLSISFISKSKTPFELTVVERSHRLPKAWLTIPRPENQVPGPDYYSDAYFTQITFAL